MLFRISRQFDDRLRSVPGLTWLPWIGLNYANHPVGRRLLIVAESHYSSNTDPAAAEHEIAEAATDLDYTRKCVWESLVQIEWTVPTFRNLNNLLLGSDWRSSEGFWARTGYCNIVQRQLRQFSGERPDYMDFIQGWRTLFRVIEVIEPSAILMIGVSAICHLPSAIEGTAVRGDPVQYRSKIGHTYARHAGLHISARSIPVHSIQHCGRYFPHVQWRRYLLENCAEVAPLLGAGAEQLP